MKAFWWYEENLIAGMARPGFNTCGWFDLPHDEAIAMGWIGQYSAGPLNLESFKEHLKSFLPKAKRFYKLDDNEWNHIEKQLGQVASLGQVFTRLTERSQFFSHVAIQDEHVHFELNQVQIDKEIKFLKAKGIKHVVSLTEQHHLSQYLGQHFKVHHISIPDMSSPTMQQVHEIANILKAAKELGEPLAVHCLAGIGRTSTMLMAAEILNGHKLEDLLVKVQKANPSFQFVGSQADFLKNLYSEQQKNRSI